MNGNNQLQTRYIRGDVVDQLFARISSGGTVAWYLQDQQMSVRVMVDNTGAVKERIFYDGFGNIYNDTNPSFGDRYKYTGRELDSVTGFQLNGARYYSGSVGRWTSQDPAGFDAGDGNLYRYVGNDGPNKTDPTGEWEKATLLETIRRGNPDMYSFLQKYKFVFWQIDSSFIQRWGLWGDGFQFEIKEIDGKRRNVLEIPDFLSDEGAVLRVAFWLRDLKQYRDWYAAQHPYPELKALTPAEVNWGQYVAEAGTALEYRRRQNEYFASKFGQELPSNWAVKWFAGQTEDTGLAWDILQIVGGAKTFPRMMKANIEGTVRSAMPSSRPAVTEVLRGPGAEPPIREAPPRSIPPAGQRGIWDIASDRDRGAAAEDRLGGRTGLPFEYPVIDRFENGVATSVKTMDLGGPSYQNVRQITSTGERYVDEASGFAVRQPVTREGITIRPPQVTQRALDLVVPPWVSPAQRQALQGLVEYGAGRNPPVVVKIVEMQ